MNNIFSPNMIKTYMTCPKKYYYQYIDHLSMPKSSLPFEKGKKIHALANYSLQGIKIDRIETALTKEEREIWEALKQNPYYNMDYFKTEFTININLSGFWLGGRIDAVVFHGNDYYILDYKTGATPPDAVFDPQTMIYLLCMDKYIKNYNKLSFVYINLKERNNYVIEFNENLKRQYEKKLIELCNKITSDKQYNQDTKQCRYCEYLKLDFPLKLINK